MTAPRKQGEVSIDLDGRGGLVVRFPDGTTQSANNADSARRIAERWFKTDGFRHNGAAGGTGRIVWHNGANFWRGARGSEQARPAGDARFTVGRALGSELPVAITTRPQEEEVDVTPGMYVRLMYRPVFGSQSVSSPWQLPESTLYLPDPVIMMEVIDSSFRLVTADRRAHTIPLHTTNAHGEVECYRIDVRDKPWVRESR